MMFGNADGVDNPCGRCSLKSQKPDKGPRLDHNIRRLNNLCFVYTSYFRVTRLLGSYSQRKCHRQSSLVKSHK